MRGLGVLVAFLTAVFMLPGVADTCLQGRGCRFDVYLVVAVVLPLGAFALMSARSRGERITLGMGALAALGIAAVADILDADDWILVAVLASPVAAAPIARTGRILEVALRCLVATATFGVAVWATFNLPEVDWFAERPLVAWIVAAHFFLGMEALSFAVQALTHRRHE